ncbi:peptidase MA family metallohydrolase [Gorillibacterium sp. sgz500922]|uniref:peptidase MA family metallohydrolase n=1 Tax=Gorillibacterium sp. sgz500922 TaxID=3446694 RepID=UPI003F669D0F
MRVGRKGGLHFRLKGDKPSRESRSIRLYAAPGEPPDLLDSVMQRLEDDCARISANLQTPPGAPITVILYSSVAEYHLQALGSLNYPDWVVGHGNRRGVYMVSPGCMDCVHPPEHLLVTLTHELTHVLVHRSTKRPRQFPLWLHEGIATYEAGQFTKESLSVSMEDIPSLKDLAQDSVAFGNQGGYAWSFLIVDYIIRTYGYARLARLIERPDHFESIYGIGLGQFEADWKASLAPAVPK